MTAFTTEREGQLAFFKQFGIDVEANPVLVDDTDGIWNGNIFEFKLNINNLNAVLMQAIKYLSRRRIKGEDVPATILLVSLNENLCYVYKSQDYFEDIHKVYIGAASKNNDGFAAGDPTQTLNLADMMDTVTLQHILKETACMPIRLDENCIVGWAERYYAENPKANKGDFLGDSEGQVKITGEIRDPKHFKGKILPYEGKTNERFKYLMDKLNDRLKKKDLGAFYTPPAYCAKAAELVRMAIQRVPAGNDYIILDRCAGTGNLEAALTDEELSHCVLSTFEYYEYKVLWERLHDKVRMILPPIEAQVEYEQGLVKNADAMSQEYIENLAIRQYVDDPKCTVILYENPPYRDETTDLESREKRKTFVAAEMKETIKGASTNELANQFIWSGFKYYLRDIHDSYVVFAPIKYWKQYNFVSGTPMKGYLFNREHFHASASAISCVLWANTPSKCESMVVTPFDIQKSCLVDLGFELTMRKVHDPASKLYTKNPYGKDCEITVHCAANGTEYLSSGKSVKSFYSENMIAYLEADSFTLDPMHRNLVRLCLFRGHGCYITKDNYLTKLPLWVAKNIPLSAWYEKDVYATTADGGDAYTHDHDFLMKCLIFTCLSRYNKCLSFVGSDGRTYLNELCFDTDTLASKDLNGYDLNTDEQALMDLWQTILSEAKATANYDAAKKYGPYQIEMELNTFTEEKVGRNTKKVYDYPKLNGDLIALKGLLKDYYLKYIKDKLFEYQLLK